VEERDIMKCNFTWKKKEKIKRMKPSGQVCLPCRPFNESSIETYPIDDYKRSVWSSHMELP
jgi:hypothetical protein